VGDARFLALGDSYTIGEGVADTGRWPMQLAARLRELGIAVDAPKVLATTGWTTDELSAAMDATGLRDTHDLVTLLIGVNDQYRGRGVDAYRGPFVRLLERAIALAGDPRRVVVVSIPDWGVTRFAEGRDRTAIAQEIDAFNAVARDETARVRARWVDITPVSRQAGDRADMLVDDGLHPSAAQYALWVEGILPAAVAALRERTTATD
jgi:lysophospholipase L1-like esterase